jgi:N-dimethylarginine dimethylaminohydrolase
MMHRWYHLDACFCPVSAHQALVHPPAFDAASLTKLKHDFELIEVSIGLKSTQAFTGQVDEAEANAFGCNAVVVGKNIVMPTHTDTVANKLAKKGFNVQQVCARVCAHAVN